MRVTLFALSFLLTSQLYAQTLPNIVLVLTDDQSWNGTSVVMDPNRSGSQSDFFQTPFLKQFAQKGMTFSQAYAPAPKCSPTRCSILTGQTTARNNFTNTDNSQENGTRLLEGATILDLPTGDKTIAEWLKEQGVGYTTAHYGKWHLRSSGPAMHGFDRSDGATTNSEGDQGNLLQVDPKKAFSITDSAIVFMTEAVEQDRPFYVQLSHFAPHEPKETKAETLSDWGNPSLHPLGEQHRDTEYGAMVSDLDVSFGLLLAKIEALGIAGHTYIFFISDNGALGNNSPLRSGKSSCYEGGIRVPFIVSGPGVLQGVYNAQPVVGYDLFPTIIDLVAGSLASAPADLDGVSLLPTLLNGPTTLIDRSGKALIFHSPHFNPSKIIAPQSAIVDGQYKFVVNYETREMALYDLDADIGETTNLSLQLPALSHALCLRLRDYLKSVNANMVSLNPAHSAYQGLAPDVDEDGLPDVWEFRELLTAQYGAADDPDGDGVSNLEEYNAGTDPYEVGLNAIAKVEGESELLIGSMAPNPFSDQLNINIEKRFEGEEIRLELLNVAGALLLSKSSKGETVIHLDTAQLPSGIYLLRMVVEKLGLIQSVQVIKTA